MSPVKLTKVGDKVRVSTPNGVKAKATTPKKAMSQRNLLNAIEHGWSPTLDRSNNETRRIKNAKRA